MEKVIGIWSLKGGSGKTTIALNLAGCFFKNGYSVLLVDDDDPQHTAYDNRANLPFPVSKGWPQDKPQEQIVIVDYSPRMDTPPLTNYVIVPLRPSPADLKSVLPYIPTLQEMGKQVIEVITQIPPNKRDPQLVAKARKAKGALTVDDRSIYQRALGEEVTIYDSSMNKVNNATKARSEIQAIYDRIMKNDQ